MRLAHAIAALTCVACGSPGPAAPKPPDASASAGTSAHAFLECVARSGSDCVAPVPAGDAWAALGELELVDAVPAPLLPAALFAAVKRLAAQEGYQTLLRETLRAGVRARDLSCRVTRVDEVGTTLIARRDLLVRNATRMGLGSTRAGARVGRLAGAIDPLRGARLVTARCNAGAVYVLVAPPASPLDPDEDPLAHPGAGWQAFVAGTDRARLLRGGLQLAGPHAPVHDPPRAGIDPWIPLSELDL